MKIRTDKSMIFLLLFSVNMSQWMLFSGSKGDLSVAVN